MIHKPIISSLAITFLCYKLLIIINKRKTYCSGHIQRSVLLCQLLSEQWIRLQTWVDCHISPPPLLWSPCPGSGASGDRKGGGATAGQFPDHMLWQGFPTAMIHPNMTGHCHIWMGHPSLQSLQREHPCKRIGARVQCFCVATGVEKREGWPMREEL